MKQLFWVILLLAVVASAYAIMVFIMANVTYPIGADFYYHLHMATLIAKGNFAGAWGFSLNFDKFPYGFMLFQIALSLIVLAGNPLLIAKILEALLMPTTLALSAYLVYRHGGGAKPAFYTAAILLSCWSFIDGTIQVRPESLDLLLYPITVLALLTLKKKTFLVTSLVTIYSHGVAALSVIYGMAVYKLREKQWRKTIIFALIAIIPILAMTIYYIHGAYEMWGFQTITSNPQALEFWHVPEVFIPNYMGATMLGVPFLFKPIYLKLKHLPQSPLESLLVSGFLGSIIMVSLWPDRWLQYISIPLACLAGIGIPKMKWYYQLVFAVILAILFIWYYSIFLHITLGHGWWQPPNSTNNNA